MPVTYMLQAGFTGMLAENFESYSQTRMLNNLPMLQVADW
jgi:hypothetical protein